MSITIYQGYSCTDKYIGKPITTEESLKSVAEFPDLRLSVCKQLTIEECTTPAPLYNFNFFSYSYYEYEEEVEDEECTFPGGVVPNYALSYDQFWEDLETRQLTFKIQDLIKEMSVWNKSTNEWDVLVGGEITDESLFRLLLNAFFLYCN